MNPIPYKSGTARETVELLNFIVGIANTTMALQSSLAQIPWDIFRRLHHELQNSGLFPS